MNGSRSAYISFNRTRNTIKTIKKRRSNSKQQGEKSNRPVIQSGRERNATKEQAKRVQQNYGRNNKISKGPRRGTSQNASKHNLCIISDNNNKFATAKISTFRKIVRETFSNNETGIINNYDEANDVEIKPPMLSMGRDNNGAYVTIAGTEALIPVTVGTSINSDTATQPGDTLVYLPIAPDYIPNTRLRFIMENYEKYLPIQTRIKYQPVGNSTLGGGIIMVPLSDPNTVLTSGANGDEIVVRAMDYANSKAFNIYNYATIDFPLLPTEQEPYFFQGGIDARLEIPYGFTIIAQTDFEPSQSEETRVIGWLKIEYEWRMYSPRLPQVTSSTTKIESQLGGQLFDNIFDYNGTSPSTHETVRMNPQYLGLPIPISGAHGDKIFVAIISEDIKDSAFDQLTWFSDFTGTINPRRGTVFFMRELGSDDGTSAYRVLLYPTLESAYSNVHAIEWLGPVNSTGNLTSGKISSTQYDLSHVL
jgi:hypothetical protein